MKKDVDCQVFEDQLDALTSGALPEEGIGQLQLHALSCPDCAMLLRVKEHLGLPSLEELEAAVPGGLLATIWPAVEAEATAAGENRNREHRGYGWVVPTLAAASVALLFTTGFLMADLRQTEAREDRMAEQILELERGLTELDVKTEWVERTAKLAGGRRNRARAVEYLLAGQESITVGDLLALLEQYPADRVLFESPQVENLLGASIRPPPELRDILTVLADAVSTEGETREVRAGDLVDWIARSGLPPDRVIPRSPLLDLLTS